MLPSKTTINPHNWVEVHADYLYAYAITRIGEEEQVHDLIQETFLAALECLGRFEGRCSERTWLTSILKNKIVDNYRNKSRHPKMIIIGEPDEEMAFSDLHLNNWRMKHLLESIAINDIDPLHNKELKLILQSSIKKLPPLWVIVFTMKYIDDESRDAICSKLNISPTNFWVIIHRAKVNLRSSIQKRWN